MFGTVVCSQQIESNLKGIAGVNYFGVIFAVKTALWLPGTRDPRLNRDLAVGVFGARVRIRKFIKKKHFQQF